MKKVGSRALLFGICMVSLLLNGKAQIYVGGLSGITEYYSDGTLLNSNVIPEISIATRYSVPDDPNDSNEPYDVSLSGGTLYVEYNYNNGSGFGTYGETSSAIIPASTTGAIETSDYVYDLGLNGYTVVSGSNLFASGTNGGHNIGWYTTAGTPVATNLSATGTELAVGATGTTTVYNSALDTTVNVPYTDVFAVNSQTIVEYQFSGNIPNTSDVVTKLKTINLPGYSIGGIAVDGSELYATVNQGGDYPDARNFIEGFDTSTGDTNFSINLGSNIGKGLTVSGSDIYVVNQDSGIGEYTTAGQTLNVNLISGLNTIPLTVAVGNTITPPPPVTPTTGSSTNIPTSSSGNTDSYLTVPPFKVSGGYGTTASLVGGVNHSGSAQSIVLGSTGGKFSALASDVVSVSGNDGSTFALQLTFDSTIAAALGGADKMVLMYDSPTNGWENAVLGDHGSDGADAVKDFQGSFDTFLDQHLAVADSDLSDFLGSYGVDTSNDTVWAVIDHNSDFSTGNLTLAPEALPEPSTWAMVLAGLGALSGLRRRIFGLSRPELPSR